MPQPSAYGDHFEAPDAVKSVTVSYDDAVSQIVPVLRFPSKGRVVGAYLYASESSSGTNVIQAGLRNGGVTGAGTIQTAPVSNGTVLAGSAYSLAVAVDGKEQFAAGEYCMLQITTTMARTNVDVQIDYRLNNVGPS